MRRQWARSGTASLGKSNNSPRYTILGLPICMCSHVIQHEAFSLELVIRPLFQSFHKLPLSLFLFRSEQRNEADVSSATTTTYCSLYRCSSAQSGSSSDSFVIGGATRFRHASGNQCFPGACAVRDSDFPRQSKRVYPSSGMVPSGSGSVVGSRAAFRRRRRDFFRVASYVGNGGGSSSVGRGSKAAEAVSASEGTSKSSSSTVWVAKSESLILRYSSRRVEGGAGGGPRGRAGMSLTSNCQLGSYEG